MRSGRRSSSLQSLAGLVLGPGAWAISTQANYVLAGLQCGWRVYPTPFVGLALALLALGGGVLSWRAWQAAPAEREPQRSRETERFLAGLSLLSALLFASVILLQAIAGLVFTGCER